MPARRGTLAGLMTRLRIDRAPTAYATCCFASSTIVAGAYLPIFLWNVMRRGNAFRLPLWTLVEQGFQTWLILAVAAFVIAAPFVAMATRMGARQKIEGAAYYAGTGGLSGAALALLAAGGETPVGLTIAAWMIGPPCGAAWGASWWYLHRRWKQPYSGA